MAFQPEFEQGEQVSSDISLVIGGKVSLRLLLTNKAAYWPGSKFGLTDGVTTERVPLSKVQSVFTGKKSQMGSMIVGILMILGGVIWTLGGFVGAPQALIVGGIAVAVVGGRRRTLRISSEKMRLSWAEPIAFGGGVKQQVTAVLDQIRDWARSNGLRFEA
jgi:hypothetical protein